MQLADHHSLEDIRSILQRGEYVELSTSAKQKIEKMPYLFVE